MMLNGTKKHKRNKSDVCTRVDVTIEDVEIHKGGGFFDSGYADIYMRLSFERGIPTYAFNDGERPQITCYQGYWSKLKRPVFHLSGCHYKMRVCENENPRYYLHQMGKVLITSQGQLKPDWDIIKLLLDRKPQMKIRFENKGIEEKFSRI